MDESPARLPDAACRPPMKRDLQCLWESVQAFGTMNTAASRFPTQAGSPSSGLITTSSTLNLTSPTFIAPYLRSQDFLNSGFNSRKTIARSTDFTLRTPENHQPTGARQSVDSTVIGRFGDQNATSSVSEQLMTNKSTLLTIPSSTSHEPYIGANSTSRSLNTVPTLLTISSSTSHEPYIGDKSTSQSLNTVPPALGLASITATAAQASSTAQALYSSIFLISPLLQSLVDGPTKDKAQEVLSKIKDTEPVAKVCETFHSSRSRMALR